MKKDLDKGGAPILDEIIFQIDDEHRRDRRNRTRTAGRRLSRVRDELGCELSRILSQHRDLCSLVVTLSDQPVPSVEYAIDWLVRRQRHDVIVFARTAGDLEVAKRELFAARDRIRQLEAEVKRLGPRYPE